MSGKDKTVSGKRIKYSASGATSISSKDAMEIARARLKELTDAPALPARRVSNDLLENLICHCERKRAFACETLQEHRPDSELWEAELSFWTNMTEALIELSSHRPSMTPAALACSCCNGTREGPVNSSFHGLACPVCMGSKP